MSLPGLGATGPDPLVPDVGPGMGQERDEALDEAARDPIPRPLAPTGPTEGEQQAAADLDASLAEAREKVCLPPAGLPPVG